MKLGRLFRLVLANLRGSRGNAVLATIGVAVGIALLSFFVGLGEGLRERVLNRIFPANQLEIEPQSVRIFGVTGSVGQAPLDDLRVASVAKIEGVARALGKQKSAFPARLWGGKRLLGFNLHAEAFFDGLPANLLVPELRRTEQEGRENGENSQRERCDVDLDCPPGALCEDGACAEIVWAERFSATALHLPCDDDSRCRPGLKCRDGRCLAPDDPRPRPARCRLPRGDHQWQPSSEQARGNVLTECKEEGGWCATERRCPAQMYCAADHPNTLDGSCELPIPTVLNPLLLEVFNSDMAASLNIAKMASTDVLYGVRYHIAMGDSHFTKDAARTSQQVKQAVVVGFSSKAPELGVALPLELVRHYNARFVGPERAALYDAILLETLSNEVVPAVIEAAEDLGFTLSRRSRIARTFGTVVLLIYLALVLVALVVLAVAALNIAQTFAMLVHERRREIAILRALGATRRAIAALVLCEAALLGLVGGAFGFALARLGAVAVDALAQRFIGDLPLVPDSFFTFPPWLLPLAIGTALIFCALGALGPARGATRLDPATVLSQS